MAYSSVVANGAGHDGRTIHPAAISQRSLGARRGRSGSALHGTSRGCSPFGQSFGVSHSSSDLDQEDLAFLSHHLSPGTKAGYGYAFQQFGTFCGTLGENSHTCGPSILVKYIRKMYNDGAEYSTVNHHRSSISKLHLGFNGVSIGCHPLVSQAVKAVFRLRPPLPKYVATFDISKVFSFIKTLPPNSELSLKLLSFKTLFLLTASSISRVSSIQRLGPDVQFFKVSLIMVHCAILISIIFQDHCVMIFTSLEKQGRPGCVRGYISVKKFTEDQALCPVSAILAYTNQVCLQLIFIITSY